MALNIKTQIENINRGLEWIRKHKPEQFDQQFLLLVENRRRLRQLLAAQTFNPGIAAYGKSQVGKSHIMGCLLQQEIKNADGTKSIKPFEVNVNGKKYNFVEQINPPGEGKEATGVVTRFSSFSRDPQLYDSNYPALMRTLSATDITLVLCDGYFNDTSDYTTDGRNEINERANLLYDRYSKRERLADTPIKADTILEMKFYFKRYINNAGEFNSSDFFNKLALIIDRIPVEDYVEVFSYLWHNEAAFTSLYQQLLNVLRKLQFSEYVYLPIDAVEHKNEKDNTIMSVFCLYNLAAPQDPNACDAFIRQPEGGYERLSGMKKSELSAVCAEVIFKIEDDFLSSTLHYNIDSMSEMVRNQLSGNSVKMDIMKNTDLLDFPGARSRLKERSEAINEKKVVEILLRGKVAYLFNKYSDDRIINMLLFCHDNEQNDVRTIDSTIDKWIQLYIGKTPEERRRTVELTGNTSPLFYIATKFNIDMAKSANTAGNDRTSIDNRWKGRFGVVLDKECFNAESFSWVRNWTSAGKNFQNSYLLRDFKYSGPLASKIFSGFAETGKEQEMIISEEHAELLKKSFCESNDAGMFFANRELSWEVAATMNNDGSVFIIENLKKAAERINVTRDQQFKDEFRKCLDNVLTIMKSYHKSDDTEEILAENLRKANSIFRELEFTCQSNPEYLGHLLQALQINETQCYSEVHRLVPELPKIVGGEDTIKDYELIRKRCEDFKGCTDISQKWKRLIDKYRFSSQEEAEDYLKRRGIDPAKLFKKGDVNRRYSAVLANELVKLWQKYITGSEFKDIYSGNGKMDPIILDNLIECIISVTNDCQLQTKIEQEISPYVDILNIATINEDLVADAISTTISDFVMDFGYRYLTSEQRDMSYRVAREKAIDIYQQSAEPRKETYTEDEMAGLFNDILSSKSRFTPAYEANYNSWIEFMYIAHIAHLNVPDFDRAANDALTEILESIRQNL